MWTRTPRPVQRGLPREGGPRRSWQSPSQRLEARRSRAVVLILGCCGCWRGAGGWWLLHLAGRGQRCCLAPCRGRTAGAPQQWVFHSKGQQREHGCCWGWGLRCPLIQPSPSLEDEAQRQASAKHPVSQGQGPPSHTPASPPTGEPHAAKPKKQWGRSPWPACCPPAAAGPWAGPQGCGLVLPLPPPSPLSRLCCSLLFNCGLKGLQSGWGGPQQRVQTLISWPKLAWTHAGGQPRPSGALLSSRRPRRPSWGQP